MKNDFVRQETNRGAILNTNNEGLANYRRQREIMLQALDNNKKIEKIQNDLDELKSMLQKIIDK